MYLREYIGTVRVRHGCDRMASCDCVFHARVFGVYGGTILFRGATPLTWPTGTVEGVAWFFSWVCIPLCKRFVGSLTCSSWNALPLLYLKRYWLQEMSDSGLVAKSVIGPDMCRFNTVEKRHDYWLHSYINASIIKANQFCVKRRRLWSTSCKRHGNHMKLRSHCQVMKSHEVTGSLVA